MSPKYEVVAGPSYAEALAVAEVVIREWIETAKALGRPIPEARGRLAYS
jgi:predicted RNase H-like HicB family nuclease